MKNKSVFSVLIIGAVLVLSMCKKNDDDSTPPYVGSWETETFEMPGAPAPVKMDFDFTETDFTAEVNLNPAPTLFVPLMGIKGDITEKPNQVLATSLTDLGSPNATGGFDYVNRTDNPAEFEGMYQQMGLAALIPKDFDAMYEVSGDQLDFIITASQDTIQLFKK